MALSGCGANSDVDGVDGSRSEHHFFFCQPTIERLTFMSYAPAHFSANPGKGTGSRFQKSSGEGGGYQTKISRPVNTLQCCSSPEHRHPGKPWHHEGKAGCRIKDDFDPSLVLKSSLSKISIKNQVAEPQVLLAATDNQSWDIGYGREKGAAETIRLGVANLCYMFYGWHSMQFTRGRREGRAVGAFFIIEVLNCDRRIEEKKSWLHLRPSISWLSFMRNDGRIFQKMLSLPHSHFEMPDDFGFAFC